MKLKPGLGACYIIESGEGLFYGSRTHKSRHCKATRKQGDHIRSGKKCGKINVDEKYSWRWYSSIRQNCVETTVTLSYAGKRHKSKEHSPHWKTLALILSMLYYESTPINITKKRNKLRTNETNEVVESYKYNVINDETWNTKPWKRHQVMQ